MIKYKVRKDFLQIILCLKPSLSYHKIIGLEDIFTIVWILRFLYLTLIKK
jgi:hypothetical protein